MLYYRPDETEDLTARRIEVELVHEAVLSVSPATIGTALHNRLEDKLAVLYGEVYPCQPFGPY